MRRRWRCWSTASRWRGRRCPATRWLQDFFQTADWICFSGYICVQDVTSLDWNCHGNLLATGSYDGYARWAICPVFAPYLSYSCPVFVPYLHHMGRFPHGGNLTWFLAVFWNFCGVAATKQSGLTLISQLFLKIQCHFFFWFTRLFKVLPLVKCLFRRQSI